MRHKRLLSGELWRCLGIWLLTLAGCLLLPAGAQATPVVVLAGDERGQGLARVRGTECFIIIPAHLLPPPPRRTRMTFAIVGPLGARGDAVFVEQIGVKEDDVAVLRMTKNERFVCDQSEAAFLKSKQEAVLALRSESGDLFFGPVDVIAQAGKTLEIEPRSEFFNVQRSMSGAVLIEAGRSRGILVSAAANDGELAYVRSIDYIAGLTGTWAKDPAEDVSSINDALDVLYKAIDSRPTGDIGQIAAIEALSREGSALEGLDFSGLSFQNAFLANARLKSSVFVLGDLSNADLRGADLSQARFRFAAMAGVKASNTRLNSARFIFADAKEGDFTDTSAKDSEWLGSNLAGVDFTNADLSGAYFMFANLQDADFTNADLTNTRFAGANLRGAKFLNATFGNTDLTGAVGFIEQFSAEQRQQICARKVDGGTTYDIEVIPVDGEGNRTSRYRTAAKAETWLNAYAAGRLDQCNPALEPETYKPIFGHDYQDMYSRDPTWLNVSSDLVRNDIRAIRVRRNVTDRIGEQNALLGRCNLLRDGSPPSGNYTCPTIIAQNIPLDAIVQRRRDAASRLVELKENLAVMEPFPDTDWRSAHQLMIRYDKDLQQRYLDGQGSFLLGLPWGIRGRYERRFGANFFGFDLPMLKEMRRFAVRRLKSLPRTITLEQNSDQMLRSCRRRTICDSTLPFEIARFQLNDQDWQLIEKRFGTSRREWPTVLYFNEVIMLSRVPVDNFLLDRELARKAVGVEENEDTRSEQSESRTTIELRILDGGLVSREPEEQKLTASQSVSRSYQRRAQARDGTFFVPWERDRFDVNLETLNVLLVEKIQIETGLEGLDWTETNGFLTAP